MLHFYWFFLFLRIIYKIVAGSGAHHAGSEEYEGSSGSEVSDRDEAKTAAKAKRS